jgi:hypothetical protein
LLHLVAMRGVPEAYDVFLRAPVIRPHPDNPLGRMLRGERFVVILDAADDELYRTGEPLRRAYMASRFAERPMTRSPACSQ